MHYALDSFDVTGELIKAQPIYGCELEGDYEGKVIIVEYDADYCFPEVSLLSAQAVGAKVSSAVLKDLFRSIEIPKLSFFRQLSSPATTPSTI